MSMLSAAPSPIMAGEECGEFVLHWDNYWIQKVAWPDDHGHSLEEDPEGEWEFNHTVLGDDEEECCEHDWFDDDGYAQDSNHDHYMCQGGGGGS